MDPWTDEPTDWWTEGLTDRWTCWKINYAGSNLIDVRCGFICDALIFRAWVMIFSQFAVFVVTSHDFSCVHTTLRVAQWVGWIVRLSVTFPSVCRIPVCQSHWKFRFFLVTLRSNKLFQTEIRKVRKDKEGSRQEGNKAGYTATEVACRREGTVIKANSSIWVGAVLHNHQKSKWGWMDRLTDIAD